MKIFFAWVLLVSSLASFAGTNYYNSARKAVAQQALEDGYIEKVSDFILVFGDEHDDLEHNHSWQKEFFHFYNTSYGYVVEVHSVGRKCFLKKIDFFQNDQDWD
ncbi:MAG: hypothetical protein ACLGG7_14280 [Bacteriovoracia bacterium]